MALLIMDKDQYLFDLTQFEAADAVFTCKPSYNETPLE
ncbi:hypothetical protein CEV33_2911 [Brucella grignonensis]|uniref:Uncharacterized protein n=1 Tax=Brucella grignonensis TaxID=94627 RepID=A0A256F2V8_9HYPH|nr:hypothetical protein CEV33_2911 [Brucella grignonensis]